MLQAVGYEYSMHWMLLKCSPKSCAQSILSSQESSHAFTAICSAHGEHGTYYVGVTVLGMGTQPVANTQA